MIVRDLGRAEYVPIWHAMQRFTEERDGATEDELWLVEHEPVYTLGQTGRRSHLLAPTKIDVVHSDRGGQITYHGPGQIVAYPLVDLRRLGIYVKELVFRIEQSVIQTLEASGVDARRVRGAPGVYVPWHEAAEFGDFAGVAKIAALGIKVSRGCSYHGVALNVAMDLTPFAQIDPCGYKGLATVDLASLGVEVELADVGTRLADRLVAHLSADEPPRSLRFASDAAPDRRSSIP